MALLLLDPDLVVSLGLLRLLLAGVNRFLDSFCLEAAEGEVSAWLVPFLGFLLRLEDQFLGLLLLELLFLKITLQSLILRTEFLDLRLAIFGFVLSRLILCG